MAKKKGRIGRIFGAITGSPYERLIKQVDKLVDTNESERVLARNLVKLVKITGQSFEEEKIDEEEHDLIIEAIEDVDPQNRIFGKVSKMKILSTWVIALRLQNLTWVRGRIWTN